MEGTRTEDRKGVERRGREGWMGMEGTGREDAEGVGGGWRQMGKGRARGEREEEGGKGREERSGRTHSEELPQPQAATPHLAPPPAPPLPGACWETWSRAAQEARLRVPASPATQLCPVACRDL